MEAAKPRGVSIGKGGLFGNVLRMSPALSVAAADLLDQAFTDATRAS